MGLSPPHTKGGNHNYSSPPPRHDVAEVAGLTSFSFGDDEDSRYVMVFKKVRGGGTPIKRRGPQGVRRTPSPLPPS